MILTAAPQNTSFPVLLLFFPGQVSSKCRTKALRKETGNGERALGLQLPQRKMAFPSLGAHVSQPPSDPEVS